MVRSSQFSDEKVSCYRRKSINQIINEIKSNHFYRATLCWARYMLRQFRLSVRPSVTRVYCIKTAERIIEINLRSDRPIILVFCHQGRCVNLTTTPPTGAPNTRGSDFRPICGYISETVIDRAIFTMEDEYKVVCALSNSAAFDDLEWPRTPVSRSQYIV